MILFGAHADIQQSQRTMVFIDGTNLFYRLQGSKLRLRSLIQILRSCEPYREIVRIYIYTTRPHYEKALEVHGTTVSEGVRVVYGEAIPTGDGNFREKGVDALLVADLVYHAAAKNCDRAIVVSCDQDFAHALTRVEDFGCRTAVISIAAQIPPLLRQAADEFFELTEDFLVQSGCAERA